MEECFNEFLIYGFIPEVPFTIFLQMLLYALHDNSENYSLTNVSYSEKISTSYSLSHRKKIHQ